jgi:hypothetical protein
VDRLGACSRVIVVTATGDSAAPPSGIATRARTAIANQPTTTGGTTRTRLVHESLLLLASLTLPKTGEHGVPP